MTEDSYWTGPVFTPPSIKAGNIVKFYDPNVQATQAVDTIFQEYSRSDNLGAGAGSVTTGIPGLMAVNKVWKHGYWQIRLVSAFGLAITPSVWVRVQLASGSLTYLQGNLIFQSTGNNDFVYLFTPISPFYVRSEDTPQFFIGRPEAVDVTITTKIFYNEFEE